MINKLYLLQKYLEKEGLSSESIKTSELIGLYNLNKNAEFLTAKRDRLQSITWNGKTYNALGYLPDGSPVALILKEDIKNEDVSSSGPFELLGQTNISVTNANETQNYNLAQYQGGNVLPVSVRPGATGVTQNKIKVDYGDASSADIAIEIAGVIGAVPFIGEPVDIGASVISIAKDPPDYLLGVIGILCALPIFGTAVAIARPALKKAGISGIAEIIAKKTKDRGLEVASAIKEESSELIKELKKKAPEIVDKYDLASALIVKERLEILEDHIDDIVLSINNYLKKRGTSLSELGQDFLTEVTKKRSFQEFYQGSKLVDDLGRPIPLFHGTVAPGDFSIPSTSGPPPQSVGFWDPNTYLGAHFAEEAEVAADIAVGNYGKMKTDFLKETGRDFSEGRTLAVFANVKNPAEISEDEMGDALWRGFAPDKIIKKMFEAQKDKVSVINPAIKNMDDFLKKYNSNEKFRFDQNFEFGSFNDATGQDMRDFFSKIGKDYKDKLKSEGYDSIKYINKTETAGTGRAGVSWIIFDQSQMRPVSDFID